MPDNQNPNTPDVVVAPIVDGPPARETTPAEAEADNAEVQAKADAANAKGYIGSVPDPLPNSAYSLQSGPDGPPLAPDDRTRFDQPAARPEEA